MYGLYPTIKFASILGLKRSKQRQPNTLNTSKRAHAGGIARSITSSTITERHLARGPGSTARLRNLDIVDEGIKRRSLLPQPSSVGRDVVTEQTESGGGVKPFKTGLRWTQSEEEVPKAAEEIVSRLPVPQMPLLSTAQKTDQPTTDKAMDSNISVAATAIKRSQSLRKPANVDGVRKPELRGHSRNTSAVVNPSEYTAPIPRRRQLSYMPSSTCSLRRPNSGSTHSSRATSAASTSGSISNISTRSKTTAASNRVAGVCLTTFKEAPSIANKHVALEKQTPTDHEQRRYQRSSFGTTTASSISNKPTRPAFTTLQQHYTPKKSAKTPTLSMIAASPTKVANAHVLSSEMSRLQTELLQLHLLHRTSAEIQRQWEDSAESTLHHVYDDVAEGYRALRFNQGKAQERTDLQALRVWEASHDRHSFSEKMGLLSRTLQDLSNMDSEGGKFARVVTTFERWLVMREDAKEVGQPSNSSDTQGMEFLESLGEGWRADVTALEMRVASRTLDLKRLEQPLEGSSLAYLVEICSTLAAQMSEELRSMREIECEVLAREAAWVRRAVDCIDAEVHCEAKNAKSVIRRGVWQTGG